jgi:transcriptional regulator with XRE-family HTH domain
MFAIPYRDRVSPITIRIQELREARGWSQAELARRAAVRQATVSAIENAQTSGIDFAVLERLADALGVDPAFLIVRT